MSTEPFLRELASVTIGYSRLLDDLASEISSTRFNPRDLTLAVTHEFRKELERLVQMAEPENMDFSPHTTLNRVRVRLGELNRQSDELLAQLGPAETQRRLLEEVTILVRRYAGSVESMMTNLREMDAEEYEEYTQDEELYNLETLSLRDSAEILLPLLTESEAKAALQRDVTHADATMRRHGAEMFGPLLRIGSIQQQRDARFEPRGRWWWYLEESDASGAQDSNPRSV